MVRSGGFGNNKGDHKTISMDTLMMSAPNLSETTEMYLKSLAELGDPKEVAISRLAEHLGITQVSANEMIKRLAGQNLVQHTPYKGVSLTVEGRRVAGNVIRRQRLWECFLYNHLKLDWAQVYELACILEHATAPAITEALDVFLEHPTHCPYGLPIPDPEGHFEALEATRLSLLPVGASGRVAAIEAMRTDMLQRLSQRGILPGSFVTVLEAEPLQGPLTLQIEKTQFALGLHLADLVLVQPTSSQKEPSQHA